MLEEIENFLSPQLERKIYPHKIRDTITVKTPTFAFYCNLPQYVKEPLTSVSWRTKIREHWKFTGVPIQIFMRKK